MQIIIKKIAKNNIFKDDFLNLVKNNIIDFANANISIIYGPNGAGKTSLAKVFNKENAAYSISIDGKEYTEKDDKIAHIINDQNDRNIIAGNTEDFIMGDNIRREYELKDQLEKGFTGLFSELIGELKGKFGISTMKSPFHEFIKNESIKIYISNLANTKQKGKGINRDEFITSINSIVPFEEQEVDQEIFNYFVNDIKNKESILSSLEKMDLKTVKQKPYFKKIEETEDAVKILEKYQDIEECIVCDNTFEIEKQLPKKKAQNKTAIDSLDEQSKKIIENIIKKITDTDPLDIKNKLRNALLTGDKKGIDEIIAILKKCEDIYDKLMTNYFISSLRKSGLAEINSEYSQIVLGKPEFEDEDVIFIENFLNECLDRKIKLDRDENKNLKLLLGETEFLNSNRKDLFLSNGEQNFLSLSFELLRAKKVDENIIILDDPISSLDSIYKNKIAYAIIKFLEKKKVIALTHTTELIKLLEHQKQNCFNLYYMNNTQGEVNGFIPINQKEMEILLYIHKFLTLLRDNIKTEIIDEKSYLVSLVPFMRGYAQVINEIEIKNKLTKIMHGYESETIDVTATYNKLFGNSVIRNTYVISVPDIIAMDISNIRILKDNNYPLLCKTLEHTFTYLYLHLNVEKKLVDTYSVNTKKYEMLSEIIWHAFSGDDKEKVKNKMFFLSRKTLLNEFNHFEMDMNIFQPAIDITNQALKKEKEEILAKLKTL